jgi:hypothetical protein
MSHIKPPAQVCYAYPVSEKHRLCQKGITYSHILPYIQQLTQHYDTLREPLHDAIPYVVDSLSTDGCYRDEHGNCVSPTSAFDWNTIPLNGAPSQLPSELYTSDSIRDAVTQASALPEIQRLLGTPSNPLILYLLTILAMPHIHKKDLKERRTRIRRNRTTHPPQKGGDAVFQYGGTAEIIEQEKLPVSKKHQAIFALTISDSTGDGAKKNELHSVIAKMTTKQYPAYYRAYHDEQRIYEHLYKKHGNKDKAFIPYYGSYDGVLDDSFAIKKTIQMNEFGRVHIDIPVHSNIITAFSGDKYTIMFLKNMSETHVSVHDYVKGLKHTGLTRDTMHRKVMDTYRAICKTMLHISDTYGLIHGDFHSDNCFVSTKDGSVVIFDFDFSCILGEIVNKSIFLYGIYGATKSIIKNYNRYSAKVKSIIRIRCLAIDLVRIYHYISYYSGNYYYFETYYKNPAYRVAFNYGDFWMNIGKTVHLTSAHFEENLSAVEYNERFADSNGFLMSPEYFDVVFDYLDTCNGEYGATHGNKKK